MWNLNSAFKGAGVFSAVAAAVVLIKNKPQALPEGDKATNTEEWQRNPGARGRPATICYQEAIGRAQNLLRRYKEEIGAPGIVAAVSINGRIIWQEGQGYADLENMVACTPDTVIRIASISKSLTMAAVAKLWEEGKLDFDKPVQEYVPRFPDKLVDGKKVVLTCRHLVSNMGGIRHYSKSIEEGDTAGVTRIAELDNKEYLIKDNYSSVGDALELFKDDPLHFIPGTKYKYSTHGWTLVAAIVEAVSNTPFTNHMKMMFQEFGMHHTYLEVNEVLIPHRSKFYMKNKKGRVVNVPYVDNSYKWAGGGFMSTVADLVKFGNILLYSYEKSDSILPNRLPGFLRQETVKKMWTPIPLAKVSWAPGGNYAMGWAVTPQNQNSGCCHNRKLVVAHSGSAIGASSTLLILPPHRECGQNTKNLPQGTVVALLTNLQNVHLYKLALEIANIFEELQTNK